MRWLIAILAVLLSGCPVLSEKYGVHGLITDPSPAQVKAGAMSSAHNVAFRRPNMVEPRPGFRANTDTVLDDGIWKLIPFDGDVLVFGDSGVAETGARAVWTSAPSTVVTDENSTALADFANPYIRGAVARKNLYLTTSDAVRKVTGGGDLTAAKAHGLFPPMLQLSVATGTTMADNTQVAYRATLSRKDVNGLTVVSAPSGRYLVSNTSGGARLSHVRFFFDSSTAVGDIVKIYRSSIVPTSLPPSDDMRLVLEYVVTSAALAATFVDRDDPIPDASRVGEALYTNPTREGIERQNIAPPRARDLALFQGSLFAADLMLPHRARIAYTDDGSTVPDAHATTGTRTNGSAVIAVASAAGLKVGQILTTGSGSSWSGTAAVRILSIAVLNITVSATWTGATDGAPVAVSFAESIRIKTATEDQYYAVMPFTALPLSVNSVAFVSGFRILPSAEVVATPVGNAGDYSIDGFRRVADIVTRTPSHAGFELFATNGASYEPALPEPTESTGYASAQDAIPNGLSWSKQDQPEHFLLSALWFVGVETSPILRIIPTRDALLIFKAKGDGIYKLTGFGERSGWRVDPVDTDTYLLHPELVFETDGRVFAWTNKGMVEVTDAGVSPPITSPIANLVARQNQTLDSTAAAFFAFAFANVKDSELVFGLPAEGASAVTSAYVFNTRTGSWSTWLDGNSHISCGAYDPVTGLMVYGRDDSGYVFLERDEGDPVVTADGETAITITAVDTSTNAITFTGTYSGHVGDLVDDKDGGLSHVVETIDATHVRVQDASNLTPGASTVYTSFFSYMTWQPDTGGSASVWKKYTEQVTHWDTMRGLSRWTVGFSNQRDSASPIHTRALQHDDVKDDTRALPPRTVAHARHMTVGLDINCADSRWRVTGIALGATPGGRRAGR